MKLPQTFRAGVGVIVIKDKKILLGTRKNTHAAGQRQAPGGTVHFGESLEEAAVREVMEETDLEIRLRPYSPTRYDWFTNNCVMEVGCFNVHFIGFFLVADWVKGEPVNMEPHKNEGWEWIGYDDLMTFAKQGSHFLPAEFFVHERERMGI